MDSYGQYLILKMERLKGEHKEYYENGQLWSIVNFKDGKTEGEYKSYYKNGQLESIYNYKNGIYEENVP